MLSTVSHTSSSPSRVFRHYPTVFQFFFALAFIVIFVLLIETKLLSLDQIKEITAKYQFIDTI